MKHLFLGLVMIMASASFVVPANAAVKASITVEQVSPKGVGVWTLLYADGASMVSTEKGINQLKYSFSTDILTPMTFSVEPPFGMIATIVVFRGDDKKATIQSNQYSFTPNGNDRYRFLVQYALAPTASLGVTSDPNGIKFRLKGGGKTYTGTTPITLKNLPSGKYTIDVSAPKNCIKPAPRTIAVKAEERNTTMITVSCTTEKNTVTDTPPSRVSKRSIVESAQKRELKPRGNRK